MHETAAEALAQAAALHSLSLAIAAKWLSAEPISTEGLKARFPSRELLAGWRLPKDIIGAPCNLILTLTEMYPNALPLVAIEEPMTTAVLPHIERDGVICLASPGTLMELPIDMRHVEFVVQDAVQTLSDGFSGSNHNDFLDEVASYWTLRQSKAKEIWLFSKDFMNSRVLCSADLGEAIIVANSSKDLTKWLEGARPSKTNLSQNKSFIVFLPSPIFPSSYPSNTAQLAALASTAGPEALDVIANTLAPGRNSYGILAFEHEGKVHTLGLRIDAGMRQESLGKRLGKNAQVIWHGYRKDHVPPGILLQRIAAERFPVVRTDVTKVDSDSMLRRTNGNSVTNLVDMTVAVVGCGAIGGLVVQLLAQAGVKSFVLVDGDLLTWQNVGRHVLTGRHVGSYKAKALKEELLTRFPDYQVTAIPQKWQNEWKETPGVFDRCDLIIALSAEWVGDSLLSKLSKRGDIVPPVIFGWVEAHGLAGHALAVMPKGGCLQCLSSPVGEFLHHVTDVPPEHALAREDSCGAFYQPFSAVSAAPTAAMVVRMALDVLRGRLESSEHRVWIGPKEDFDVIDASLRSFWFDAVQTKGHEHMYRLPLFNTASCPVCGDTP